MRYRIGAMVTMPKLQQLYNKYENYNKEDTKKIFRCGALEMEIYFINQ